MVTEEFDCLADPALLAKAAATLDVLSGGRFELGLGAGWMRADYEQSGIPYDPPPTRVARFEEATRLIDRLLREEVVDHSGTYYQIKGARILPRPVQKPRPPFMIGGGGMRVLRFAARVADIVSFAPNIGAHGRPKLASLSERSLGERVAMFRSAAGARADAIDLNIWLLDAGVSDRSRSFAPAAATIAKRGANAVARMPFVLYGSRSSLRALLRERRERLGINYISIPGQAMDEFAPVVQELRGT